MSTSTHRPSSSPSPTHPPETTTEILYNTAVQSFVRRDHTKTHATLSRLLEVLRDEPRPEQPWHELDAASAERRDGEEWVIKTLKLVISAHVSLYTDPPANAFTLPQEVRGFLPPKPPSAMLHHIQHVCVATYFPHAPQVHPSLAPLLPPQIVATLLLASLKLKPPSSALDYAHSLAEDWLARLPDAFVAAISQQGARKHHPEEKKRLESAREGYLKVVELFVGEVLAREGEWEMARTFLEGEVIMSSKRKENLYRHLRAMQTKPRPPVSPSSSLILPSPSPSPHKARSRSSSVSSSSSEATARPGNDGRMTAARTNGSVQDRKGKGKAEPGPGPEGPAPPSISSESTLPSKIFVNHPTNSPLRDQSWLQRIRALLPPSLHARISSLPFPWLASAFAVPLPLLLVAFLIRRRRRPAAAVTSTALDAVRQRLQAARGRGFQAWLVWWIRWWIDKVLGVWRMGTTITYV